MVAIVDVRRLMPRTDAVLADPRLAAAEQRLGRESAIGRCGRRSNRPGPVPSARGEVADTAVAALPPAARR